MRKSRLAIVGLGVMIAAGLADHLVRGFSAGPAAWPTSDVIYYINGANADVSASAARAAIQVGARSWSEQSAAAVQFVYGGTTNASSINYDQTNNVFFRNESNGGAIASAYRWWAGPNLLDSDIVFWDASNTFFTGTSGCRGGAYIEDIAAHEFGHALGLDHTGVSGATMKSNYGTCSQSLRSLHADDVAGVESMYPPSGNPSPPSAPSNLIAQAAGSHPQTRASLSWTDTANNENQFLVQRSNDGQSFQTVGTNGANDTTYTDSQLQAGRTYWYRVRASNGAGNSSPSPVATMTTDSPTPDPEPEPDPGGDLPAAVGGASPSDGATRVMRNIKLRWSASSGAHSYDVYFGESANPPLQTTNVASTSFVVPSTLRKCVVYYWRVDARNNHGSTAGRVWSFRTRGCGSVPSPDPDPDPDPEPDPDPSPNQVPGAPTAPEGLWPSDDRTRVFRNTVLVWTEAERATSYTVYFGEAANPPMFENGVTATRVVLPTLRKCRVYHWRVVAVNDEGSTSSPVWSFTSRGCGR